MKPTWRGPAPKCSRRLYACGMVPVKPSHRRRKACGYIACGTGLVKPDDRIHNQSRWPDIIRWGKNIV